MKYPPGFPLVLSLVWLVNPSFPANAIGFKAVSVFFTIGLGVLVYRWLQQKGEGEWTSVIISLLTLFNPLTFGFATSAFSEMTFSFFSLLGLWAIEWYAYKPRTVWTDAVLPALAVAIAFYLRSFGIVLVGAGIVYLFFTKDRQKAVAFGVLSFGLVAPWFVRSLVLPSNGSSYWHQFLLKSIEQPELGTISAVDLAFRVILNLRAYLLAGLPGAAVPSQVPLTYVNLAEGLAVGSPVVGSDLILAVLVASGLLGQIVLRRSVTDLYVGLYLALGLLWPWEPTRFTVPLIPFLYTYVVFEMSLLGMAAAKLAPKLIGLHWVPAVMALLFVASNVFAQLSFALTQYGQKPSAAQAARSRVYDWIRNNTRPTDIFAAMNDYQLYLYANRPVIRLIGIAEDRIRSDANYVALIPYGGVTIDGDLSRIRFDSTFADLKSNLRAVYEDPLAGIQVLQVKGEAFR